MKKNHEFLLGVFIGIVAYLFACTLFMDRETTDITIVNIAIVLITMVFLAFIATFIVTLIAKKKLVAKQAEYPDPHKHPEAAAKKLIARRELIEQAKMEADRYLQTRKELLDEGFQEQFLRKKLLDFLWELPSSGKLITQKEDFITELANSYGVEASPEDVYLRDDLSWEWQNFRFFITRQKLYYFSPAGNAYIKRRITDKREHEIVFAEDKSFPFTSYQLSYCYEDGVLYFVKIGELGEQESVFFNEAKTSWEDVVWAVKIIVPDFKIIQ